MDINNIVNSTRMRNARLLDDINNKILNREYYKFKYLPFEGALPGLYFQQQTEDAINDIGNVAYATEKVADEALQVAQQAYNIALAALETANNALAAAQTAQQTANTALNIANNALSVGTAAATAAAAAQNRADKAYDLADAAQKAADAAQNTADAAQEAANNAANDATNALTKAKDALTKIEQLSVLNYYNNLTEATDVNTLVDIHRWYLQASNNPNAPETNPGFLNVDNDHNDSVCKQLWVSETTGAIYNRFGQIVENSDPATVSSWSEWYKLATKADIDGTTTALTKKITTVANNLATHEADFSNPHKVTAEQLGLTTVYQYKGSVATYADLPTTGQKVGDVWNVETADPDHGIKAGDNVAWDGAQWDILGGNHDLSGYAQLNSANTYTALNTFRANIAVSNGTTAGSSGSITLGISPADETVQARIGTDNLGGLFYHASTNQPHVFRVGTNNDVLSIRDDTSKMTLISNNKAFVTVTHDGVAKWLGNANTATKALADINGNNIHTTYGKLAGNNTWTGNNYWNGSAIFNANLTIRGSATTPGDVSTYLWLGTQPEGSKQTPSIARNKQGDLVMYAADYRPCYLRSGAQTSFASVYNSDGTVEFSSLNNSPWGKYTNANGLELTVNKTPTVNTDVSNKKYVDDSIANGDVNSAKYLNITNFIPSNSDFNDYKTPGEYQVQSNTEANTIANLPTSYNDATLRSGVLSVLIGFNAPRTSLIQIYRTYGSSYVVSRTYQRCFYHENSSWTAWREIACTDEVGLLNQANTYTALNTFRANIIVSNGTAAGSQGQIVLGVKPRTATVQANIISSTTGALNYIATENTGHYFKIGNNTASTSITTNESETAIFSHNAIEFARITNVGVAKWLGNANTATKLETARTINGVAFDGTKDITIEAGGGGGDVTAAGDNNFTGTNTFNKPITVRDGALAGIGGTITLGMKPNSATTQAKINSTTTGAMYYTATEGLAHFFNVGTAEVATIGGTATTATLDFLANSILKYSTSSGLRVGGGGTRKIIGFYPEAADNTAGMRLSNQAEAISTDYSVFSLQNNPNINYANNAALQVGSFKFLEIDKTTKDLAIMAETGGKITLTANAQGDNTATFDIAGNLSIAQGLTVGSTTNTGISNGVIRAGNNESCLYFTGTAENTYYATPNTGNTINYQSAANCYLINCSINNPSSLNMNFSNMNFKATVGSVPYMCKTLTFWLPVGATVPAVTWTFPTGSAVYYPKGVAPTLTANANNIINVIAVVDDTGSFSIQVCDTVVLPYSG